jgi:ribose transport system ATP-binding protein
MAGETVLEVHDVTKRYPGVTALDAVSFDLRAGEVHCLVGENGAGKSTLIKILSGAVKPDGGTIRVFGQSFGGLDPFSARRLGIQTIYQESNLVDTLTVGENIFVGDEKKAGPGLFSMRKTLASARDLLGSLNIAIDPASRVSGLSISEKQLVKLAKGLARNARILILDEPTASLNKTETEDLLALLKRIKTGGIGIIYISHRLGEVFTAADRISVLRDGKMVSTRSAGGIEESTLIQEMVGKKGNVFYTRQRGAPGGVVLEVEGYRIRSGGARIRFALREGEILGMAGMVGAGRSELVKGIFGAEPAAGGRLALRGAEVRIGNPRDAIKAGICLVPEDRQSEGLVLCRDVRENTTLAGLDKFRGFFIPLGQELRLVGELVRKLNIKTPSAAQRVQNLSGGNQQKTVLAKWIFSDARVLIFDEPTRGIDVGAKQEIYRLMSDLAAQGKALIMISSDMPELIAMSDRVIVLRNGEIAGILERERISEQAILALAIGSAAPAGNTGNASPPGKAAPSGDAAPVDRGRKNGGDPRE